jgi:hypothetical protein
MNWLINLFRVITDNLGWYNLNSSKKYRLVKENYRQTAAMINIQPLVAEILNEPIVMTETNKPIPKFKSTKPKVFQYWHQGFDNLPEVVQNCYQSVDYFLSDDFEIVRIDYSTLSSYIILPRQIIEARNENRMTIAHLSDIVRNKLLLEYGGLWLDSSVLLTGKKGISDFIDNKLVSFQNTPVFSNPKEHPFMVGSWMIWAAKPGCAIFRLTQQVLEIYWDRNNEVSDYFLYHIIVSELLRKEKSLMEEAQWHRKHYSPNTLDLLFFLLGSDYSEQELISLMVKTNIHKLDFKLYDSKAYSEETLYTRIYNKQDFQDSIWPLITKEQ